MNQQYIIKDSLEKQARVIQHWQQIGKDECRRRKMLMDEADRLCGYFVEGLIRIQRLGGDTTRFKMLVSKSDERYKRRAIAYYGEW